MLEIVPLGGLGEFGMNMLALTWGETTIVIDAGVMFPDPELLGVDRIIPDLTYLQQKGGAAALVLTHGHEDHIGGVPHVMPHINGPIYGTLQTVATGPDQPRGSHPDGWHNFVTQTALITGATGIHDLYLSVRIPTGLGVIDWFQFRPAPAGAVSAAPKQPVISASAQPGRQR